MPLALVVTKGSKMRSSSAAGMPVPRSLTVISTRPGAFERVAAEGGVLGAFECLLVHAI